MAEEEHQCLASGGDKDQDRLQRGVGLDGSIGRLVHGGHARAVELAGVALYVTLQGHWPHAGLEIEQPLQGILPLSGSAKQESSTEGSSMLHARPVPL